MEERERQECSDVDEEKRPVTVISTALCAWRLGRRCQVALTKRTNAYPTYLVWTHSGETRESSKVFPPLLFPFSTSALLVLPLLILYLRFSIRNFSRFIRRYF